MSFEASKARAAHYRPPSGDGPLAPSGQVAWEIINAAQAEVAASVCDDSPAIKIGPLSDPDSACTIILARSRVGSEIRESTLIFRSAMISELFWAVEPGEKGRATVIGEGVYYPHAQLENDLTIVTPTSSRDQLTLIMELSEELDEVSISYITQSLAQGKLTFRRAAK
jgi:hypothetical protein